MDKNAIETMVEEIRTMKEGLETEKRDFEARMANYNAPINTANAEKAEAWRDVKNAMVEKRAITVGGTGKVNLVSEIVKIASQKNPILGKVRVFTGANASTNIPVLSPSIGQPAYKAEGATGLTGDTSAKLGIKSLTPNAFVSVLPVTDMALLTSGASIEAELPSIFSDAFARCMHKQIIVGSGENGEGTGVFKMTGAKTLDCAKSGAVSMIDLVNLALSVQEYADDACILIAPSVYSSITASAEDDITRVYKEILIRDKMVENVPVILTSDCLSDMTTGNVVAVAGRLSEYALAVAQEMVVEPFRTYDSLSTYYRATAYFNCSAILPANWTQLLAK